MLWFERPPHPTEGLPRQLLGLPRLPCVVTVDSEAQCSLVRFDVLARERTGRDQLLYVKEM